MGMKVSDILLDLATGDASVHDAYIQEAVGQVNVSAAIYRAAEKIAALDDDGREQIVQEAADAGLPSDEKGAIDLAYEATARELIGTFRHIYSESAMIMEATTGKTAPVKAIAAIAKKAGCTATPESTPAYAKAVVAALHKRGWDIDDDKKFIKASAAERLAKTYINGTSLILNAYGIDTDELYDSGKYACVGAVVKAPVKIDIPSDGMDLDTLCDALEKAEVLSRNGVSLNDKDYAKHVSRSDIAAVITCYLAITEAAEFFAPLLTDQGKKGRERMIKTIVATAKDAKKGISKTLKKLHKGADEEIDDTPSERSQVEPKSVTEKSGLCERLNKDFQKLGKNLKKGFNDSVNSIILRAID